MAESGNSKTEGKKQNLIERLELSALHSLTLRFTCTLCLLLTLFPNEIVWIYKRISLNPFGIYYITMDFSPSESVYPPL